MMWDAVGYPGLWDVVGCPGLWGTTQSHEPAAFKGWPQPWLPVMAVSSQTQGSRHGGAAFDPQP